MRPRGRCSLLLVLGALSCRKPAPAEATGPATGPTRAAPRDAAAPGDHAPVDAPAPSPDASPWRAALPPDAGLRRTREARDLAVNAEDPWALAASPRGALWVRAVNRPGQRVSEIVATVLGRDGRPAASPRVLRRTTGPVRAISVDAVGEHVWIAWHTVRGADDTTREEHLVAALHGSPDLGAVGDPITVRNFAYDADPELPYTWSEPLARVFVRDDGGALLVSTGARTRCVHGDGDHSSRVPCEGWDVSRLELDGRKRVEGESALCPSGVPTAFVRAPGGLAYMVRDDHIGTKILAFTVALGAQPAPRLPTDFEVWHYSPGAMAWSDGVFAFRGQFTEPETDPEAAGEGVLVRGGTAVMARREDAQGNLVMPGIRLAPLRCAGGHVVARVRWVDGPSAGVTFDPTHPGSSLDLVRWADLAALPRPAGVTDAPDALVWAGEALVGLFGATLARWTCASDGNLRLAL